MRMCMYIYIYIYVCVCACVSVCVCVCVRVCVCACVGEVVSMGVWLMCGMCDGGRAVCGMDVMCIVDYSV